MLHETVEQKLSEILELLRQKDKQTQPEQWEDVTEDVFPSLISQYWTHGSHAIAPILHVSGFRLRKIDGMHNGPAFIVEKRKA